MPAADLVIRGTVLTVDDRTTHRRSARGVRRPHRRGRATGRTSRAGSARDTETLDLGDGCVMPGLVEAHGHPLMEAIVLSDRMVDIRPVTMPKADDVVAAIRAEVAKRGADGAYLNGWDPLLQSGPARAHPGVAEQLRAGYPAGDHPQLRAQGVLQLPRPRRRRTHPRHPRPEGRQVRPRRQRRPRRHRGGDRRGVPAVAGAIAAERLPGDAARRTRAGSTASG